MTQEKLLLKLFDGVGQGIIRDMDIAVHGCFDAGMTEQPLQDFRQHSAFNRTGRIGVSQSVHTKPLDLSLIAEFVQMRVIGTVFGRFSGTIIDKHQISHTEILGLSGTAIHIFQNLRQQF